MFFAVSIILSLVSCDSNGKKQQNSPPEIGKIDPKTYSTSKDVWLADTKASCGDREITSNPNLTYGIDLLGSKFFSS